MAQKNVSTADHKNWKSESPAGEDVREGNGNHCASDPAANNLPLAPASRFFPVLCQLHRHIIDYYMAYAFLVSLFM